jgi:hypothetical protein
VVYISIDRTEVLACPPDEPFQTFSPLWLEKLPMEKQSTSVGKLEAAMQNRLPVCNI